MRAVFQIFVATVMLGSLETIAQTVRVTALDVATPESSQQPLNETAQQLKALAPDVILLRGVTGWKMAAQLAKTLIPVQYHVTACSAFGNGTTSGTNADQVAILTRKPAFFSWSEPWKLDDGSSTKGGFTFAALEIAGHRIGFLSLNLPHADEGSTAATEQWLQTLNSYRGWSNNRLEGFLVATFRPISNEAEAARLLRSASFRDPLADEPASAANNIVEGHLVPNADSPKGLVLSKALTCDFDFRPAPIIVLVTNVLPPVATQISTSSAQTRESASWMQSGVWWIVGGLSFVLLAIFTMLIGIRRRLNRLQSQNALVPVGAYNLVIASPTSGTTTALAEAATGVARVLSASTISQRQQAITEHGLLVHFAQWLKQTFVQRLINDRQKLLADQQVAARKVLSVDERLARLETRIQQQTAEYEKEIELLNQKLLTAREENLELIRSQIKFLKSEMEATRSRLLESEEP